MKLSEKKPKATWQAFAHQPLPQVRALLPRKIVTPYQLFRAEQAQKAPKDIRDEWLKLSEDLKKPYAELSATLKPLYTDLYRAASVVFTLFELLGVARSQLEFSKEEYVSKLPPKSPSLKRGPLKGFLAFSRDYTVEMKEKDPTMSFSAAKKEARIVWTQKSPTEKKKWAAKVTN